MDKMKYFVKTTIAFTTGIAVGYIANLFVSTSDKKKQRQELEKIKNSISTESLNEITENLFGKSATDMKAEMDSLLQDFYAEVSNMKETIDSFDVKKYQRLVDNFASKIQEDRDFSNNQIEKLKTFLKSDYQKVMQNVKE